MTAVFTHLEHGAEHVEFVMDAHVLQQAVDDDEGSGAADAGAETRADSCRIADTRLGRDTGSSTVARAKHFMETSAYIEHIVSSIHVIL